MYVFLSSEMSQRSATPGSGSSVLASSRVRPSKMLPTMRCSGMPVTTAQSSDLTSVSLMNVKSAGGKRPISTAQATAPSAKAINTSGNQDAIRHDRSLARTRCGLTNYKFGDGA